MTVFEGPIHLLLRGHSGRPLARCVPSQEGSSVFDNSFSRSSRLSQALKRLRMSQAELNEERIRTLQGNIQRLIIKSHCSQASRRTNQQLQQRRSPGAALADQGSIGQERSIALQTLPIPPALHGQRGIQCAQSILAIHIRQVARAGSQRRQEGTNKNRCRISCSSPSNCRRPAKSQSSSAKLPTRYARIDF